MDIARREDDSVNGPEARPGRGAPLRRLAIDGAMPPGWAGRVAAGLAARRVNVVRGHARRIGPVHWIGELEVEALDAAVDAAGIDLLALAAREPAAGAPASHLHLDGYRIEPAGDDLRVHVRARDQVGFLERLLGVFAMFVLFPREMEIETVAGEVRDTFTLRAMGDRPAPPALVRSLEAMLARLAEP